MQAVDRFNVYMQCENCWESIYIVKALRSPEKSRREIIQCARGLHNYTGTIVSIYGIYFVEAGELTGNVVT